MLFPGAQIILACRDIEAGEVAAEIVRQGASNSQVSVSHLDLLSFESIRNFVKTLGNEFRFDERLFISTNSGYCFCADCEAVDILINNAGVVFHPEAKSKDGFEIHIQTNYLGNLLFCYI